jgi:hypothetical protein
MSGIVSGVDPAKRLFTKTRAPEGRDCTLILPAAFRDAPDRSEKLIAAVVR